MASKMIYWKCVDCNSMINDENMHLVDGGPFVRHENMHLVDVGDGKVYPKYAEFCYGCMIYNPEVVIAYR